MPSFGSRLQHAWNAFIGRDPTRINVEETVGYSSSYRPDRMRFTRNNARSIVTTIYNRIAVDVSNVHIEHVRLDDNGRYLEAINSGLNQCLTVQANLDQTGRAFIQDVVQSMFDDGCVAIVPVDTTIDPTKSTSYEIETMRTGRILEWYPKSVRVNLYNERTGRREDIILPKSMVAIVENPFYASMNEPNSTLQRLLRTLNKLDLANEQSASGKLDLIIQLPYVVKSPLRKEQAEARRRDIEAQLTGSKYGIAYTDGTERITQLNRAVENNLWTQAKELTTMLYNQLGLTQAVLDGTADEKVMNNYFSNTIDPILAAIVDSMICKFLTKTARSQKQSIKYFREPFKLVPVSNLADIADKFTRNEILSSNEIRAIIGYKPSKDPKADELRNKNLNQSKEEQSQEPNQNGIEMAPEVEGDKQSLKDILG